MRYRYSILLVSGMLMASPALAVPCGDLQAAANGDIDWSTVLPGDFNLDGKVDILDLTIVSRNYGCCDANWTLGDANHDGKVDLCDLTLVSQAYGSTWNGDGIYAGAAAVQPGPAPAANPEPVTAGLAVMGLGALAVHATRRRRAQA